MEKIGCEWKEVLVEGQPPNNRSVSVNFMNRKLILTNKRVFKKIS